MRALRVLGGGGWITRRRVRAALTLAVVLAASLVPVVQFAELLASRGGVYAPSSPPDYSAALQAFTKLGARIVAVGPKYFVDGVVAQAEALGLVGVVVVAASPSELPLVVSAFNRSLILDDFGAQPVNYTLAAQLAPHSFIVYLNTTPAALESTVDGALYLLEYDWSHRFVALPLLTSGPLFVAEGLTALGGYPFVDVGYNTTLQGLVYAWYESFHDPPTSDPCGVNTPSGYNKIRFTDAGNPYSDGYATWTYDECIVSPNSAQPDWWPFNTYAYSYVAPTPNYALRLQGLAVDTNYGYALYKSGPASTFISYDTATSYPASQSGTTSYNLDYYNFVESAVDPLIQFLMGTVSDPVSVTNGLDTTNGGLTANDTWVFESVGYNYGVGYVSGVNESDGMWFPSSYQEWNAYMMVDSNFTLASQAYSPNIFTSCVNYYYYALRVQWVVVYTLSSSLPVSAGSVSHLWKSREVVYTPSGSQPPQPQAAPTLTPSGPYSTWSRCTYHPAPT